MGIDGWFREALNQKAWGKYSWCDCECSIRTWLCRYGPWWRLFGCGSGGDAKLPEGA